MLYQVKRVCVIQRNLIDYMFLDTGTVHPRRDRDGLGEKCRMQL